RRRAPDLSAQPDKIPTAHPLHHGQPSERCLEQRTDAEHGERDDRDESEGASEDRIERLATAMQGAVRERQQPVGSRRQREADGREQVDEPGMECHGRQCCWPRRFRSRVGNAGCRPSTLHHRVGSRFTFFWVAGTTNYAPAAYGETVSAPSIMLAAIVS